MNSHPKRSTSDIVLHLMIISGFMLLICAVPEGIVVILQTHYESRLPLRDAIIVGAAVMGLMAAIGFMLMKVGLFIVKRLSSPKLATDDYCE